MSVLPTILTPCILIVINNFQLGSHQLWGYQLGTGTAVPTVAAVWAVLSVTVGVVVLVYPVINRAVPVVALLLGLVSATVGGLHAANADGGLGTGNGLATAVVAFGLGMLGVVLGGLALIRAQSNRTRR